MYLANSTAIHDELGEHRQTKSNAAMLDLFKHFDSSRIRTLKVSTNWLEHAVSTLGPLTRASSVLSSTFCSEHKFGHKEWLNIEVLQGFIIEIFP